MISDIPKAHAEAFSAEVKRAINQWDAMTPEQKAEHYDKAAAEMQRKIDNLNDRNMCLLPTLMGTLESYRESAEYYRKGGLGLAAYLKKGEEQ